MADTSAVPSPEVADESPLAPDVESTEDDRDGEESRVPRTPKKVIEYYKSQIALSKSHRRSFHSEWKTNVDLRLGRVGTAFTGGYATPDGDDIQTEINPDWSLTKVKTANLYSQTPEVQLTHEDEQYKGALAPFRKALNYELGDKRANIGVPMEEVLNDVVNAAGVGGMLVGYVARFVDKAMPAEDLSYLPPDQQQMLIDQQLVAMVNVPQVASYKFFGQRISPTDLLWPASFVGSNFDDADWIGRSGRMGWADAKNELRLTDEQKEAVVNGDDQSSMDSLRAQPERGALMGFESVRFDEIFYWRARVDPEEKNLKAIWRMVFVHGITDGPVIDEPWIGQKPLDGGMPGQFVGATKFPIQILTLTYITDNPVPPSDSFAGRPQVNDLRRSRRQMFMNRDRSRPIRWFDVNRVDRTIQDNLMRGDWQGFIPTNGDGSRSIGEIARASYPQEDFAFDRQTQADLDKTWMIGPNQSGTLSSGEKTKAEVETTQASFATRIGQERTRVQNFFLNVVEVLGALMALYSDFPNLTDQERQQLESSWNTKQILGDLVFKVRPDSTIMLDASQRVDRLTKFLNITAQSGVVDIRPIIEQIAELSGLDPATIMKQPETPKPADPSISFRFSGKEDLFNPMVIAVLNKDPNTAITAEDIAAAKTLLMNAADPTIPAPQPPQGGPGGPQQPPTTPGEPNHPDTYAMAPKIASRSQDMNNA